MQTLLRFIAVLTIACACSFTTTAQEEEKPAKAKPELVDLTLVGTVESKDVQRKNKKTGEEETIVVYTLKTEDGNVNLPKAKDVDYAALVGSQVTVTGQGTQTTRTNKKTGKETVVTRLRKVTAVEGGGEITE